MPLIVEVVAESADNKNAVILKVGVDTRDENINMTIEVTQHH